MVYFRLKFSTFGNPRTALLTDRGWTVIHADSGMAILLNHICPLPEWKRDQPAPLAAIKACADRAAELLQAEVEPG